MVEFFEGFKTGAMRWGPLLTRAWMLNQPFALETLKDKDGNLMENPVTVPVEKKGDSCAQYNYNGYWEDACKVALAPTVAHAE